MDINGRTIGHPHVHPYTPIRLFDVNNTIPYDPAPRSGGFQHNRYCVLPHIGHNSTSVQSVYAYTDEGEGDSLDIEKKDYPGLNLLQCGNHTIHSSEEELEIIAQEFSAKARKLASQRNELKVVSDKFSAEAERLVAKRLAMKLKAAMKSYGVSVMQKSEEELGIIAEEFSAEAETLATQRMALRLKATMNSLGLSLMNASEDDLGIIADEFRAQAELLANHRRNASISSTKLYKNEVLSDAAKYDKDLAIVAEEFATEARLLAVNRQSMKQSNTITNNNLKEATNTRPYALPEDCSETTSSQKVNPQRQSVVKTSENHCRKTLLRQKPSRVSPRADGVTEHEEMPKANMQQIALMFRIETPRKANVKTTESNSKAIVTRHKASKVCPEFNEVSKGERNTNENMQQIALLFRVETPTVANKNTSNIHKEKKNTSRLASVRNWLRNLRGVVFGRD